MGISETVGTFKQAFFEPEETFEKAAAKKNVGWFEGLKNNAIAFLAIPIVIIPISLFIGKGGLEAGAVTGIMLYISALVSSIIVPFIFNSAAMMLGGKGTAEKSNYVLSILNGVSLGIFIVMFAVYFLMNLVAYTIPAAALIAMPISVVLLYTFGAYHFHMVATAVRTTHNLSTFKSLFAFGIAMGVIFIIAMLFLVMAGVGAGMAPSAAGAGTVPLY
ncbi:MAG: hypothetical protein NTV88_05015 [Candidatus Micrarchaeota archaeon]|nr:hypothetical protein [Candidatus Micrarchaeota archaeon]